MMNFGIFDMVQNYLSANPNRFNDQEKKKFVADVFEYFGKKSPVMADEVYDFLVEMGFIHLQSREQIFASYLNKKYSFVKFRKVLDIGSGRMCKLSQILSKYGYEMHAIDPNIRLLRSEAKNMGLASINKDKFVCDEYAPNSKGTDVSQFDLIVGLEPCDATEHIIRQALKYNIPFEICLCAAAHDSLDGKKFKNYSQWYNYLKTISNKVSIKKINSRYIASNIDEKQM